MSILKNTSKDVVTTEGKFFGGYLPDEVFDFICLYSVSHGITKTVALREMANEFLKKTLDETTIDDLIIGIIVKIEKQISEKAKGQFDLKRFVSNLRRELTKKGITNDVINRIVSKVSRR